MNIRIEKYELLESYLMEFESYDTHKTNEKFTEGKKLRLDLRVPLGWI